MKEITISLDEVKKDKKEQVRQKVCCEREKFCLSLSVNVNICALVFILVY